MIDKDLEETEIQKLFRLRKMGDHPSKQRPMFVQFIDKMTNNYLMNNLYHIRKTPFKDLAIFQDMTLKERDREQCKKLVKETKKKGEEEKSGNGSYEQGVLHDK